MVHRRRASSRCWRAEVLRVRASVGRSQVSAAALAALTSAGPGRPTPPPGPAGLIRYMWRTTFGVPRCSGAVGRLVVRGHCRSKAGLRRRSRARRSKTTFARHTPSTARVQDTWRCRAQQDTWRCAASHSGCFARHWARHWRGLCCACAPVDVRTLRERCTPALRPGRLADIRSATLQQCCAMLQPCRSCAGI